MGGGVGEGDDQNFRRRERTDKRGIVVNAVATEYQPYVKQGDGEGFTGASAGLYQPAAVEREA